MSARKSDDVFSTAGDQATTSLLLAAGAIHVRKNGIEFRAEQPIPLWHEMTVDLQSPRNERKIRCTGVVVSCHGNRHTGYIVTLLFTRISKQSQEALQTMVAA